MTIDRGSGSEKPKTPFEILMRMFPEDARPETPPSRRADLNAALPNVALALCCALALGDGIPLLNSRWLGTVMAIEFLAIHSFPFMMLISSYRPATEKGKKLQRTGFWGLLGIYFIFAADTGGLGGIFVFGGLTVTTYLGYLRRRTSPDALALLAVRWATVLLAFIVSSGVSGMPSDVDTWPGHPRAPYFGMMFFLLLGSLEGAGFYRSSRVLGLIELVRKNWKGPGGG